jgi:hypothetical protein
MDGGPSGNDAMADEKRRKVTKTKRPANKEKPAAKNEVRRIMTNRLSDIHDLAPEPMPMPEAEDRARSAHAPTELPGPDDRPQAAGASDQTSDALRIDPMEGYPAGRGGMGITPMPRSPQSTATRSSVYSPIGPQPDASEMPGQ